MYLMTCLHLHIRRHFDSRQSETEDMRVDILGTVDIMGVDILGIHILGVDIPALPHLSNFRPFYLLSSYVLSYPHCIHVRFCNWRDFTFNLSSKEQIEITVLNVYSLLSHETKTIHPWILFTKKNQLSAFRDFSSVTFVLPLFSQCVI